VCTVFIERKELLNAELSEDDLCKLWHKYLYSKREAEESVKRLLEYDKEVEAYDIEAENPLLAEVAEGDERPQ
jgi:hypothetical protein